MAPQPVVPQSEVVVPDAPLAATGDTPIGRAAEAAVGVRGAAGKSGRARANAGS